MIGKNAKSQIAGVSHQLLAQAPKHLGPVMPRSRAAADDAQDESDKDSDASDFEEVPIQTRDSDGSSTSGSEGGHSDEELDNLDDQVGAFSLISKVACKPL